MAFTGTEKGGDSRGDRDSRTGSHPLYVSIVRTGLVFGPARSMKERRPCQKSSLKSGMDPSQSVKCKIVVVGDSQCGKTALLHVFAKDCFPEVRPAAACVTSV